MPARSPRSQAGFSLIEVLVAVAIVAVLATTLLRVTGAAVHAGGDSEERTIATIIASNYIVRLQQAEARPSAGELSDTVTMAGRKWAIHADVKATDDPSLSRLLVHVAPAGPQDSLQENGGTTLVGFVGEH